MPHVPTSLASSWGQWAVFVSVLATQLGVPVPVAPMLIVADTLIAQGARRSGRCCSPPCSRY